MQSFIHLLQNREMTGYKVIKRTRMCFGRTDRAFTIGRSQLCGGALIICYMFFFNINVPFGSDYFVLISQHNLSVFSFQGLKDQKCIFLNSFLGTPKLGLTHSRCAALTVKSGIGMTAIGAQERQNVLHIYYIQFFVVYVLIIMSLSCTLD